MPRQLSQEVQRLKQVHIMMRAARVLAGQPDMQYLPIAARGIGENL